jgi:hypothetical protein
MRSMTAAPSAADTRPRWPAVYRPAWKLLAISVGVGIAGVIGTIAAFVERDTGGTCPTCSDPSFTPVFVLLGIGLLLWGSAVTGWAVRKGSSWPASLVAGVVALVTVFGTWAVVLLFLVVLLLAISGGG